MGAVVVCVYGVLCLFACHLPSVEKGLSSPGRPAAHAGPLEIVGVTGPRHSRVFHRCSQLFVPQNPLMLAGMTGGAPLFQTYARVARAEHRPRLARLPALQPGSLPPSLALICTPSHHSTPHLPNLHFLGAAEPALRRCHPPPPAHQCTPAAPPDTGTRTAPLSIHLAPRPLRSR